MIAAFTVWLIFTVPIGLLVGIWGFAAWRRGRRLGWALLVWAFALPFVPPLLTYLTWLRYGDEGPVKAGFEPWPYTSSVAIISLGVAILATPIFLLFVSALMANNQISIDGSQTTLD